MTPFQKDKLMLLKELQELVSEELTKSHEFRFGKIEERRRNRKLKLIRKELGKWIQETMDYRKASASEQKIMETRMVEAAENATQRYNTPA